MDIDIQTLVRKRAEEGEKRFFKTSKVLKSLEKANNLLIRLGDQIDQSKLEQTFLSSHRGKLEEFQNRLKNAIGSDEEQTELISEIQGEIRTVDPLRLSGIESDEHGAHNLMRTGGFQNGVSSPRSAKMIRYLRGTHNVEGTLSLEEKAFCFKWTAWSCAVLGFLVVFSFLTFDYAVSSRNPTIEIGSVDDLDLQLPAITGCSNFAGIPAFENYPTKKYPGYPLFLLKHVSELENGEPVTYPLSIEKGEILYVGSGEVNCSDEMQRMSAKRSTANLYSSIPNLRQQFSSESACKVCIRSGSKDPRIVSKKTLELSEAPVQLKYSISGLLGLCRFQRDIGTLYLRNIIENELKKFWKELEDREILNFGLYKPGNNLSVDALTLPSFSDSYREFLCNVYFYSGFFYPNSGEKIQYKFDRNTTNNDPNSLGSWIPVGTGPYFEPPWNLTISTPKAELVDKPGSNLQNLDLWGSDSLELYSQVSSPQQSLPSFPDLILNVEKDSCATLRFRQILEEGDIKFQHSIIQSRKDDDVVKTYREYQVNVELESNDTKTVATKPSMSFVEYLTDLMEFAGLFTGVCLFSIMVAPANVYLTRFRRRPKTSEV